MICLPEYKGLKVIENRENSASRVFFIENATEDALDFYRGFFEKEGFSKEEERFREGSCFCAYYNGKDGVFINYYANIRELYIVEESDSVYFSQVNVSMEACAVPQITQVKLEDYGMSYVIRLPDGRFIVIDGGREFLPDAERLFGCLVKGANGQRPKIACWIMTHPHSDHFHCFLPFMDIYGDKVDIESFLFNFPERDDVAHYPKLTAKDPRFEDSSPLANIPEMYARIERSGARVYTAHTGQIYRIGEAVLEILSTMDDTIHCSDNINSISTVIRMALAGQIILWAADASFSASKLSEKYGTYLKSDILQVPHHGFQGGTAESEIDGYRLILPKTAFLPVSDFNAFTAFCIHKPSARYLMEYGGLEEMITGEEQRTIDLPYCPSPEKKATLENKVKSGLAHCGSDSFVFTSLNTSKKSDFEFTFLNTTHSKATVWIELFFESSRQNIRAIKLEVAALSMKKASIIGDDVNPDALYFNWMSLKEKGIPESCDFAVRFISTVPLIISHAEHSAAYHS